MKVTDLTRTLREGEGGFTSSVAKTIGRDGWNAVTLCLYSHAGTHIDAPPHFNAGNTGIGEIPVENFIADCWIADLSGIAPGSLIGSEHLGEIRDKIRSSEGILFRTGWSSNYDRPELYRNRLPRLSEELVSWCIKMKIRMIGVEQPSVADVNNIQEVTLIHTLLLKAGVIIIEGLVNLELLHSEKVMVIALPLKIENGDGSPCRAIAIENDFNS